LSFRYLSTLGSSDRSRSSSSSRAIWLADADQLAPIGVDYIFAPSYDEMYPPGFATHVEVEGLSDKLEGLARPGYFRSVTTALTVLFNLIHPK
jgi:pantothenate synthetase